MTPDPTNSRNMTTEAIDSLFVKFVCQDFAELANLKWAETITAQFVTGSKLPLANIDPFFESIGTWDTVDKTISVYRDSWLEGSRRLGTGFRAVQNVVVIHFCAHAVTQLGVHPRTKKQYLGVGKLAKMFVTENYPLKPSHGFYDQIIREEEFFAQIFSYLLLWLRQDRTELEVFDRLSVGHCALYDLHQSSLPSDLTENWRDKIRSDPLDVALRARKLFARRTRGVPVTRTYLTEEITE